MEVWHPIRTINKKDQIKAKRTLQHHTWSKQEENQRGIKDKQEKQRIKIDGKEQLHDLILSPKNAVTMKFLRRVEP